MFELGDIIEALQSVGRRNSQPVSSDERHLEFFYLHVCTCTCIFLQTIRPHLGDTRDMPNFTSMPTFTNLPVSLDHNTTDDTLTALGRFLRPSSNPTPLEKMLTPVEERPAAEYDREHSSLSDEGETDIVPSSSCKLDSTIFSRSTSGLSNAPSWHVGELDSDMSSIRDSTSILSSGCGSPPPRQILNSSNSMDIADVVQTPECEDYSKVLENHDEKGSSQGSDDSSTFSESAPTAHFTRSSFNYAASPQGSGSFSFSSAEGTPVRTMSETRKRDPPRHSEPKKHLVTSVSDTATHVKNPQQGLSPQSSTHSSVSGVTLSSQSSLGEEGTSSDASDRKSKHQKKYRKYEKYERYERYDKKDRSQSFDVSPECVRKDDVESPGDVSEHPQGLTQDSNGTLTDENSETVTDRLKEVELSSTHSLTSTDSYYQNMNGQTPTIGEKECHSSPGPEQVQDDSEEKGTSELMKDILKTLDSGIDDTNSPLSKSSEAIQSPVGDDDDDDDVTFHDESKPTSYKLVFASSRDSMLTDSLDTDSLNDDKASLSPARQAYKQTVQQSKSSPVLERQMRASSEVSESSSIGSPAHVEVIIEDGKPARLFENKSLFVSMNTDGTLDVGPEVSEVKDEEEDIHDLERNSAATTPTAPRSLEGPTFSRYARVPIRSTESKSHIRAAENPLYDSASELRQRACSLNDLDDIPPPRPPRGEEKDVRTKRAASETRSIGTTSKTTLSLPRSSTPSNPSGLHQSTSASTDDDLQVSGVDRSRDKPIGGSLRLEKKSSKRGKGLVSKLRPALRVFKITPSSSAESKKARGRETELDSHTDEGRDSASPDRLIPRPYEEVRKMRMMSPETMAVQDPSPKTLRRSQSSDDILQECTSGASEEAALVPTKVGPVFVIPEASKSKRRKFLGFQHKKYSPKDHSRSRESSRSPVVLVDVHHRSSYRRVSVEPIMNLSANSNGTIETNQQKSPKSKRRRHPHFV